MKKTAVLLSLALFSLVILTACGKKSEEPTQEEPIQTDEIIEVVEVSDCEKAVQKYLDWADKEWRWEEIKQWDNIVVDYIWRLEDWTVFDTSIKSIAEACDKYSEYRDYTEWLSFQAMWWQMVKWFDEAVIWMKLWQTKTVKFWPEKWYGEYNKEYVVTYTSDVIWDLSLYEVWNYFQPNEFAVGVITNITDKEMTVDFNSELAGKDLIFDITIKSIN